MTIGEHFVELRKRLVISAIAVVVGMVAGFILADPIIDLLTIPIRDIAEQRGEQAEVQLMFTTVTSAFDLRLRISFAVGPLLSAPIWIWQAWAFVMPGLTRKEIGYTAGFVGTAIPLFFGGTAVGWIVMPHVIGVMASFAVEDSALLYEAQFYYDFVFKLLLVIGVAFVLPVFLVALNVAGVVSGRAILRGWRIAVIVATVFAAVATPAADAISMLILAGILVVLFFAAAGVSLLFDRRRAKRLAAEVGPLRIEPT